MILCFLFQFHKHVFDEIMYHTFGIRASKSSALICFFFCFCEFYK